MAAQQDGRRDGVARERESGPLTAGQVVFLMNSVAPDVDAWAAAGAPHGRISPEALRIEADGRARLTGTPSVAEAEAHAAPEILAGAPSTIRSEVFSLASTTYTLLTGHPPNPYGFATVRRARPDLGPEVDGVIAQATARGPEFRFPSAVAFSDALGWALDSPAVPIAPGDHTPAEPVRSAASAAGAAATRPREVKQFIPDAALPWIFLVLVVLAAWGFFALILPG
ncbi:hypothetical protein [Tsukamurella sp. 1534]|uniref:hypothetical protein n=1 Tax=Tsukamurella sp. 1534 TaxID=1151061 RepID=UPI000318D3A2|nr:hypothetical protein [Tsukamurella sp. 1534]